MTRILGLSTVIAGLPLPFFPLDNTKKATHIARKPDNKPDSIDAVITRTTISTLMVVYPKDATAFASILFQFITRIE